MTTLSYASANKKTERLKGFKFLHFYWLFSSDIMAAKGNFAICKRYTGAEIRLEKAESPRGGVRRGGEGGGGGGEVPVHCF